ncbi:hypothetical protein KFE25_010235 [Diacronema lutheri]|uniref:Phosphofructokinase domain-containing protein n=1 Tax=Diacronema lutheri TaxID=2081491 RepID=A0A8J5XN16_DIALT|nr:hypothetical protein KFE25_010235 [Diacronema lutheri]
MDAAWYAANNPFKREAPRHTVLKRTAAVAVILGVIFVISGYMHAADTRGSAQPSAAHFAAGRGELVQPHVGRGSAAGKWQRAHELVTAEFVRRHPQGFNCELVRLADITLSDVFVLAVPHLSQYARPAGVTNVMGLGVGGDGAADEPLQQPYHQLLGVSDVVLRDIVRKRGSPAVTTAYLRAGPRASLHFDPSLVRAAIVTCGGLCPGLNNIIQGLVRTLLSLYGVHGVLGVRGGYQGFRADEAGCEPVDLTLDAVVGLQHQGGTLLGSGRGSFDLRRTIDFLQERAINQLYVVGGDGTHRAANEIAEEARRLELNVAVVGIPKTIDNDIDLIDRSFGFATAVEEAQAAIRSAQVEARCNLPNGIGIVKLMGRSSGFIAVHATLASGEVDLCLVPEVPVVLDGEHGLLCHLERVLHRKGHALVVVAEGAGEEILGQSATVDAGGNRKLPELGLWLKERIGTHFGSAHKKVTVKYIDPSYMIRSVPANAADAIYCLLLAQNAVHGAMAWYTAYSVGMVNNRLVYIPINALVANSPRMMEPNGRTWERVIAVTGQPDTARGERAKGRLGSAVFSRTVL